MKVESGNREFGAETGDSLARSIGALLIAAQRSNPSAALPFTAAM